MMQIVEVESAEQLRQALAIRVAVFVEEQGVARALEIDGRDDAAQHFLALREGQPVGTLRLRWVDDSRVAKIERVAVLPRARGAKFGQALVQAALAAAGAAGAEAALLHAQTSVQDF
jgi:predicted GNAT family N-acyltransferase